MPLETKKPGDMVDGYRIMSELGRGAASIIYVVQELKTKQVHALKHVIKETDKDQRFIDQAEQEYKIASRLKSPTIRKIERVIRRKDGGLLSAVSGASVNELFLVMEHVDGASCEREPPQTFEDAVYIFEQVAVALAHMHDHGFVHADMKPNNIIVNHELKAKIIDLGQSCKVGTVKQRIQGTPDYIAPEQVHRREIVPKTDVYNLGATMYWILTRHFVPTAMPKEDSLVSTIDDTLIPRPRRAIEINPRIPEMLDQLIMQCVEIKPEDRPTMPDVAERLNLIRGKLVAEQVLRRSGQLPKVDLDTPSQSAARPGSNNGTGSRSATPAGNIHESELPVNGRHSDPIAKAKDDQDDEDGGIHLRPAHI